MEKKFIVKVFFRGDWCPWCSAYLKDFDENLEKVNGLGGTIVGITSQEGNNTKENNNLRFDVLVDNKNIEAQKYDIVITAQSEVPYGDAIDAYAHGMVQPGVVIEDTDGRILYRWAINPNEMNFGGAKDRPLVADIIGELENILNGVSDGNETSFRVTDMEYLEKSHPAEHQQILKYLASVGK